MSRVFLIFSAALVALMAGALFYAARIPVQATRSDSQPASQIVDQARPNTLQAVSHPAFELPDVAGNIRQFSEWQGKSRIVNFWATWCAPCRREIPLLKALQDEQSGNGFQVIGIAVDFAEDVSRFAESADFNYPVLVGQEDAMAVAESTGIEFVALPFTMFVAADGEYLSAHMGELHEKQLTAVVDVMTRLERAEIDAADARLALQRL